MRRIGSTPAERGSTGANNCPDVIELDDGAGFLVIGRYKQLWSDTVKAATAHGATVGDDEAAVIVPRDCLLTAARQIVAEDAGGHDGRNAYRAYAVITQGLNFQGDPMPEWDDLPVKIKAAWVNAATGVHIRSRLAAVERVQRWANANCDPHQQAVIGEAIGLIDPRDPRSLDGD